MQTEDRELWVRVPWASEEVLTWPVWILTEDGSQSLQGGWTCRIWSDPLQSQTRISVLPEHSNEFSWGHSLSVIQLLISTDLSSVDPQLVTWGGFDGRAVWPLECCDPSLSVLVRGGRRDWQFLLKIDSNWPLTVSSYLVNAENRKK